MEQNKNIELIVLKDLDIKSYRRMQQYIFRGKLKKYKTERGCAINAYELAELPKHDIQFKQDDFDGENMILLSSLGNTEYMRIYNLIKKGKLKQVETSRGLAVNADELETVLELPKSRKCTVTGYRIDLSQPSRLNRKYKRLADMNKTNRDVCRTDSKLTRYVDENGYVCINLADYCMPQIRMMAKKIECKPHEIVECLYDVLFRHYQKAQIKKRKKVKRQVLLEQLRIKAEKK